MNIYVYIIFDVYYIYIYIYIYIHIFIYIYIYKIFTNLYMYIKWAESGPNSQGTVNLFQYGWIVGVPGDSQWEQNPQHLVSSVHFR